MRKKEEKEMGQYTCTIHYSTYATVQVEASTDDEAYEKAQDSFDVSLHNNELMANMEQWPDADTVEPL